MQVVPEMKKIRDWLTEHGIVWEDASTEDQYPEEIRQKYGFPITYMCRTIFHINNHRVSVINGYGSYGGYDVLDDGENKGLLEMWCKHFQNEPVGWLSADNVIEKLKEGGLIDG